MSTRPTTVRRLLAAVLLSCLAVAVGCGDSTAVPSDLAFSLQPPVATMVVGQQRDVGVAWAADMPADAQASWVVRPDSIVRIVTASTWGATLEARRVGTALVTLTVTSQGRAVSRDMVVAVDPLACPAAGAVVSPTAAAIAVGGRVQLSASSPYPPPCGSLGSRMTFRSLDSTIATVDVDGWVTGRRPGVVTIVASPPGNPGLTVAAQVTVLSATGSVADPPTVQPDRVDAVVGDTVRLRGAYARPPNAPSASPEVRFRSADSTVATVDATGLLRAVRVGQTHVRAIAVADTSVWTAVPVTVRQP